MKQISIDSIPSFFLVIFCLLVSCGKPNSSSKSTTVGDTLALTQDTLTSIKEIDISHYANAKHLINPKKYLKSLKDSSLQLVLLDVRKIEEFKKNHIPGAYQVWRDQIQSKNYEYGGMRLSKEELAELAGSFGASSDSKIILYDSKGCTDALRLWWMFAIYGHEECYVLNGGLDAWPGEKTQAPSPPPVPRKFEFADKPRPELIADMDDLKKAITDSNTVILDCRKPDEFAGKIIKKGAFRAGRIPTSIHIEHSEAVAYENASNFRELEDLKTRFTEEKLPHDKGIIVYCQSGVRSAHTTFVLRELMGYRNVRNYDGSWIEWSFYKENEIVQDSTLLLQ